MSLKTLIDKCAVANSILSGGMASLIAYAISLALAHFGIILPPDLIVPMVVAVFGIVAHFTPDSFDDKAKALDADVKKLAAILPQIKAEYPTGKNAGSKTGKQ